jgi:3-hydroxybutyryl-CoA dehydrogenase
MTRTATATVAVPVPVLVIGAGIMGAGIAQVAAQAGHRVMLHDMREGAAEQALARLSQTLQGLVAKGRLSAEASAATLAHVEPLANLADGVQAGLVVEAIVEDLAAKRALFGQLEALVSQDCILATNTSSISVTAIANGLKHPGRLVGMHFFNPVPLMKLVEVVSGLQTRPDVAHAIERLSQAWGKVAVHARSTPGFIVNRIARPYYAETLALLQEQAATPAVLDACLRGAGFRMGPCELMDLIGHDTNYAVTRSVFEANFFDKRYTPSLVQREMVDGGLFGRKSGRGFFEYAGAGTSAAAGLDGAAATSAPDPAWPAADAVCVMGSGVVAERLASHLAAGGQAFERDSSAAWTGLRLPAAELRLTDGRPASALGAEVAVFDLPLWAQPGAALAWAPSVRASAAWQAQAAQWLQALGFAPQRVADAPGLVVARTLAMLINEAADAVHQGVCSPQGADQAMKLGVNYPAGPFEWLAQWDAAEVIAVLDALDAHYRGERYRVSPWLRQQAWAQP